MKIAIIGTRGIPNNYGGFEQFAEYLSLGLVNNGHVVSVFNSHTHPYQDKDWRGVEIIHCNDPEKYFGTVGQFIYDFNCIKHTRGRNFDIILQLGYTSSSIWGWLLPRRKSIVTTNMDGLEWKRSKYSKWVRKFLLIAEKNGVKYSDYLISDSIGIQDYLRRKYNKTSIFIPYGANLFTEPDALCLNNYKIDKYKFNMLIARLEPENNIETILDGIVKSKTTIPFLVIGNYKTRFGKYLKDKFNVYTNIRFLGSLYDIDILNNLRYYSNLYFHGHTVGGTNPSLLEAMASQSLIVAHNNIFNKSILGSDAFYFSNAMDIAEIVQNENKQANIIRLNNNAQKITDLYTWPNIVQQYLEHFEEITAKRKQLY